MEDPMFTDYYEILEISPNANSETIERIFRYLAMRYHPDNQDTADQFRFSEVVIGIKGAQFDCMTRFEGLKFEGGELEGMSFLRPNSPSESQAAIQYR